MRGILTDYANKKLGMLTVIHRVESDKHGQARWLCRCACGEEVILRADKLKGGAISCGCARKKRGTNTGRKKEDGSGYVYLMALFGRYKIGSSGNVQERRDELQTGAGHELLVVHSFFSFDMSRTESFLQYKFRNKKIREAWSRGDWFELTPEDVKWIISFPPDEL